MLTSFVSRVSFAGAWAAGCTRSRTAAVRMATPVTSGRYQAAANPFENKCIQDLALLGGCQAGVTDGARRPGREVSAVPGAIAGEHAGGELKVLCSVHADQVR